MLQHSSTTVFLFNLAWILALASLSLAKEFHYGASFGDPFEPDLDCQDVNNIGPELLFNWGLDNHRDATLDICHNSYIKFLPYLWGRPDDDDLLSNLPASPAPWAVLLENEPNWWGGQPLTAQHGDGANMTATAAAAKWPRHLEVINKWGGPGTVKVISPSPVDKYYPNCANGNLQGCAWQTQFAWMDEYFANCGGCYDQIWAINQHDYSCNVDSSRSLVADLNAKYPGKNVFFGELGCNGVPAETMAQYLLDFTAWAYNEPSVVGFVWAAINYVSTPGSELSLNGAITVTGNAFKQVQQQYPPMLTASNANVATNNDATNSTSPETAPAPGPDGQAQINGEAESKVKAPSKDQNQVQNKAQSNGMDQSNMPAQGNTPAQSNTQDQSCDEEEECE